jgi:hypothetical protein
VTGNSCIGVEHYEGRAGKWISFSQKKSFAYVLGQNNLYIEISLKIH